MASYYETQQQAEHSDTPSIDKAAHPTAALVSTLTVRNEAEGEARDARSRFGYCLGRWIYLMDAADDWERDHQRGLFNPFSPDEHGQKPYATIRQALNSSLSECLTAYHLLTRYQFDSILQNILQYGMPAAIARVTAPNNGKER